MGRLLFAVVMLLLITIGHARTSSSESPNHVPVSPASPLLAEANDPNPCSIAAITGPVTLADAVNRGLCGNPKTRVAWASVKLYAAAVEISKNSFLPTASIKAAETESDTDTRLTHDRALDTSSRDLYPAGSLAVSWVLFDFGQRSNQLLAAREQLAAARANLDLNLQQVFLQVAEDYYDMQAAQASAESTQEIESLARRSVDAAHRRVDKGVAPVSDEYQAQTAYGLAVLNRVKAAAQLAVKRGALAGDMGIDPDQAITLPPADPRKIDAGGFSGSVRALIEEAKRNHPSVAIAERSLAAAQANVRAARAHGRPTISLVAGLSRSNESLAPSLGSPSVPGNVSDKSIGIQIDVPISDALWKRGQVAQARAQVEIQQENLNGAELQVAQDVWKAYIELQADTDTLANSESLMASAQQSMQATQHRYEGGVGNILELLGAQSAYANAEQQRIKALSDWRYARLSLGASLGGLGLDDIDHR